jgi:thioredoxin-dependent peroxiredoxin
MRISFLMTTTATAVLVLAAAFLTLHGNGHAESVMPAAGQSAPDFTLPSQDGTPVTLSSFRGKWVVLYFYPKDMTPGCTMEAHNFQRDLASYEAANAVILGVSVDSAASHKEFCTKESLTFRLLADPSHSVVSAYGSLGSFAGIHIANRNTFLIDPDGRIAKVWTKVEVHEHSQQVLAALAELKK